MRARDTRKSGQNDLFKARLDQIVELNHARAKLGRQTDGSFWRTPSARSTAMSRGSAAADAPDGGVGDLQAHVQSL